LEGATVEAWEAYRFFEFFLKNCRNFDAILIPFVDPIIVNSFFMLRLGAGEGRRRNKVRVWPV